MNVLRFPLSKIAVFFILGIIAGHYIQPAVGVLFISGILLLSVLLYFHFKSNRKTTQYAYFGILVYLLSLTIGTVTEIAHNGYNQKSNYINQCVDPLMLHTVEIRINEKLKKTTFNTRYIASVNTIDGIQSSGKILLNIRNDSMDFSPAIGQNLRIHSKISKHKPPYNPDQFNYGKYLTNKSVFAQIFSNNGEIEIGSVEKSIWYYASAFRENIILNLEKSKFDNDALNVVTALILGQQQEISKEILQDYQYAGAVHILSVSGLHVGFILLFLNFILAKIPKTKKGSLFKFLMVFITLWIFAVIAGLSPSVVRSVTMFSFVAFGMHIKRETNIFHTLIVSALLILIVSPSFLFDVGFQLSYFSLFFILWLQPLLNKTWVPKNKILNYLWNILTVSIAAQIGALPLSIYYFHQFPGLFFVTNMVILPFLGIIMATGVIVMLMAAFNYAPTLLATLLEFQIRILNDIISWIASFEKFIIKDIPLNLPLLFCSYLLICIWIAWFQKPTYKKLLAGLCSILLFQICTYSTILKTSQKQELLVFQAKKRSLIIERFGNALNLFSESNALENQSVKAYMIANFCDSIQLKPVKNLFYFKNKKIILLDSMGVLPKNCNPDLLIITKSPRINLERILLNQKPKKIIADGSNFKSYVKLWKATCEREKIPFHATAEKGFYKIE